MLRSYWHLSSPPFISPVITQTTLSLTLLEANNPLPDHPSALPSSARALCRFLFLRESVTFITTTPTEQTTTNGPQGSDNLSSNSVSITACECLFVNHLASLCLSFLNHKKETEYLHQRLTGIKQVRACEAPRTVLAHYQRDVLAAIIIIIINLIILIILKSSPLATK